MKKHILATGLSCLLLAAPANAVQLTAGTFNLTSQASAVTVNATSAGLNVVSNLIASSTRATVGAAVGVANLSGGALRLTSQGMALSFNAVGGTSKATSNVTGSLFLQVVAVSDVSLDATVKLLQMIGNGTSQAANISSAVSARLVEYTGKGISITGQTFTNIMQFLYRSITLPTSEFSTNVSASVIRMITNGAATTTGATVNIVGPTLRAMNRVHISPSEISRGTVRTVVSSVEETSEFSIGALEISGETLSMTAEGVIDLFEAMSRGSQNLLEFFSLYRDEIEQAVEDDEKDMQEGVREIIREELLKSKDSGSDIEKLLGEQNLDNLRDGYLKALAKPLKK